MFRYKIEMSASVSDDRVRSNHARLARHLHRGKHRYVELIDRSVTMTCCVSVVLPGSDGKSTLDITRLSSLLQQANALVVDWHVNNGDFGARLLSALGVKDFASLRTKVCGV